MAQRLKRFVEDLENRPLSFRGFLLTFMAIIFLRNFLETFADVDNFWTPVSPSAYFLHYPMFYLCLILAVIIVFRWLTGEKILRITKIVFFFFPIVLLAPILDLVLSAGQGYNISYLFGDLPTLLHRLTTFSFAYLGRGITPGIQIELILAFLLTACYLFLKTRRLVLAIAGVMVCYVAGFVLGALPSLVNILWNLNGSGMSSEGVFTADVVLYHFYSFNHKITLILFPILLGELAVWYWLYDRRKFLAMVKNLRGLRVLHYLCMLAMGMLIGHAYSGPLALFESPFPSLILLVAACAGVLAWWWAVGVNDLHDLETDKISNHSRPLASGAITAGEYRLLNIVFLLLSLVGATVIRYPFLVTILVAMALSYMYSAPPLRLKRVPFLATFILALCSALICLAGYLLFSDDYSFIGFPPRILAAILVAFTLGLTVIDMKDREGDRATGALTLPILFGEKKGAKITGGLTLLAYLSVPVILKAFIFIPVGLLFGIPTYLLINRKPMRERPVFLLYYLFLGAIAIYVYSKIQGG